ncbi:MAG: hypothetical protein K8J31_14880, partial [Anaerolineae bacterium]|nr:hypothetical protein [Anaerolineae bacterium]
VVQRLGIVGGLAVAGMVALLLVVLAATIVPSLVLPTPTLLPTPSPLPPTPTPGFVPGEHDVTVAVAPFAVNDASVDVEEADLLVLRFSNLLDHELNAILNDPAMRSQRLTYGLIGPKVLDRVAGETLKDRQEIAQAIARQHGVDVVVFGEIRRVGTGGPLSVQPEFYVSPETYFEAQEITGPQRFGTAIEVDDTQADFATPSVQNARGELSSRTTALAQVVIGLSRYALGDYDHALLAFQQAQTVPNWEETHGREILNVLIGNSYLKVAQEYGAQCDRERVLEQLDQARSQYETAQTLNPNASRAWAGLASLSYLLAQWQPVENAAVCESEDRKRFYIDLDQLEQAREYAREALLKVVQPLSTGVRIRVLFTQAQAVFGLYASEGRSAQQYAEYLEELMTITDQIIALIDEPGVQPMALDSYFMRATAAVVEGDCPAALEEFSAFTRRVPADISEDQTNEERRRRMFFTETAARCNTAVGQLEEARQLFGQAIQIAELLESDFDVDRLERELRTLNGDHTTEN